MLCVNHFIMHYTYFILDLSPNSKSHFVGETEARILAWVTQLVHSRIKFEPSPPPKFELFPLCDILLHVHIHLLLEMLIVLVTFSWTWLT